MFAPRYFAQRHWSNRFFPPRVGFVLPDKVFAVMAHGTYTPGAVAAHVDSSGAAAVNYFLAGAAATQGDTAGASASHYYSAGLITGGYN